MIFFGIPGNQSCGDHLCFQHSAYCEYRQSYRQEVQKGIFASCAYVLKSGPLFLSNMAAEVALIYSSSMTADIFSFFIWYAAVINTDGSWQLKLTIV